MKRVLGIGHALVDMLVQMSDEQLINDLALPRGSMTLIDKDRAQQISKLIDGLKVSMASGGSAANTIHGAACLGVPCGFIGKVHNDELGKFYENDLRQAGIYTIVYNGNAPTGRANTFISPDSERTFATYLGASVEMQADELNAAVFSKFDLLHIEGYLIYNTGLIEKAFKMAKENNMLISLDLASFNVVEDNREFLMRIIPQYVDLVFANEEEAKAYTGKGPHEALDIIANECDIAVVKVGKNGSLVSSKGIKHKIGIVETNPVDTTGAGDQYAAGFIYGLNMGLPLDKCGQLGALLAGKVIEKYGARIQNQDWPEILEKAKKITA